jgi:protein-disulfide isomerase
MSDTSAGGTSRGAAVFGMILTFVGGYFAGAFTGRGAPASDEARQAQRLAVPVGLSPSLGARVALVTIVEFADFQCGYCARSPAVQQRLLAKYPDVRWVFKSFPLRKASVDIARASLAAHAQGRFWEFRDQLFHSQRIASLAELEGLARDLGLDLGAYQRAMQGDALEKVVRQELAQGQRLGIKNETPTFFINGRRFVGTLPYEPLEKIVQQELTHAGELLRRGVSREQLYDEVIRAQAVRVPASAPAVSEAQEGQIYRVAVGASPVQGPSDALVTAIVFGDFQCAKSAELMRTLVQLRADLGDRLRLVYKHFPLQRNLQSPLAAEASLAAHAQGAFWSFQAQLFASARDLSEPTILRLADVGRLRMDRFKAALDGHRFEAAVRADAAEAGRLGLPGTPGLFLNGRYVRGVRPVRELREMIDEELRRAQSALRSGTPRERLYEVLTQGGAARAAAG